MPGEPVIRRLTSADVPLMRRLNALFGEAFEAPEVYGGLPPDDAYLRGLLDKPHVIALAALDGDVVVGGLTAYELDKLEQVRRELYIFDLAVAGSWRRRGVATALIRRVQAMAAERNAWVVFVQADPEDEAPTALYGKLGIRQAVLHFNLPVRPDLPA